jgi:hypothetical protein
MLNCSYLKGSLFYFGLLGMGRVYKTGRIRVQRYQQSIFVLDNLSLNSESVSFFLDKFKFSLPSFSPDRNMPSIFVRNKSSEQVECFVTKFSNDKGDDSWYPLGAGKGDAWTRGEPGWELVAFKYKNDRAGVYVKGGSVVTFHDLKNITVD